MKKLLVAGMAAAMGAISWSATAVEISPTTDIVGLDLDVVTKDLPSVVQDGTLSEVNLKALSVPGDANSWGRLAVDADSTSGVLVTSEGTWWLATDAAGDLIAVNNHDAVARIPAADRIIEPKEVAVSCDSLSWTPAFASHERLLDAGGPRTFSVAFAYDALYKTRYGASWETTLAVTISVIDELLFRDAGIHLEIFEDPDRGLAIEEVPASVVAETTTLTLAKLQDYYVANYGGQVGETVFLFSGKDFTNAGGQVNCVGSAGRTTVSYGVASVSGGDYNYPGGLILLPDPGIKIGAHELGHTLSAHHHYANCVEAAPRYNPVHTTDACTILINDWGLVGLQFSSVERLSMMGWADKYNI